MSQTYLLFLMLFARWLLRRMKHPLDRSPDSTRGFASTELAISVGVESRWIALETHGWRALIERSSECRTTRHGTYKHIRERPRETR